MNEEDVKLLKDNDWIVECESPFEIKHEDGDAFASGLVAQIVLDNLKHEKNNAFSEQDMHDCFNAGINRGINIAAIIMKRELDEEFPTYQEYMKKYDK